MRGLFITGIGTEVGKTFIVTALLKAMHLSKQVEAIKPVISGFDWNLETDTHQLLSAMGKEVNQTHVDQISPFRFKAPLSVDRAASLEGKSLCFKSLLEYCQTLLEDNSKRWLIEGVGGVMVPLNEEKTVLDWIERLNLPVMLIASSYLGAISHTLCAVKVLQAQSIQIKGIVVNQSCDCVGLTQTAQSIEKFVDTPVWCWPRGQLCPPKPLTQMIDNL